MSVDSTIGGASADSYVSLADANAYFLKSLNRGVWTNKSDDDKSAALITATRQIDMYFEWIGIIQTQTQALAWPRKSEDYLNVDIRNENIGIGYQLDKDPCDGVSIPKVVKFATMELAYLLLTGGYSLGQSTIDEIKVGPIQLKFSETIKESGFPKDILEGLKRIGTFIVSGAQSVRNIRLTRA